MIILPTNEVSSNHRFLSFFLISHPHYHMLEHFTHQSKENLEITFTFHIVNVKRMKISPVNEGNLSQHLRYQLLLLLLAQIGLHSAQD